MSFKGKMEETAKKRESSIVLALDFPFRSPEKREELLANAWGSHCCSAMIAGTACAGSKPARAACAST
jgi:hypothetical protein